MRCGSLGCGHGREAHTAEPPGLARPPHTKARPTRELEPHGREATSAGGLMDVQLTCLWLYWQLSWNRKLVL